MVLRSDIDISFDFRTDTPAGADPDAVSPTLRKYHHLLWSKTLPGGAVLELDDTTPGVYLHHRSSLGEFFLSSDSVIPSFRREQALAEVIAQIPKDEWEAFMRTTYTIGGMMVFPGNRIDRKMTINGARGFHPRIKDRFELTVECIRRHYRSERSPLSDTLARYADFFDLFESFQGYVEYFLLQDLVSPDYSSVHFFAAFEDFSVSPLPGGFDAYRTYRQRALEFIEARNERILNSRSIEE
jgi:hypothetical protein